MNITRVLKPRLTFGLGNSQGFGLNSVLADSVVARVQPEPTAGVGPTIRFFDPLGSSQQFVVLDSDAGGVGDGLFGQLDSSVLRVVAYDADFTVVGELFTAAGTPTSDATAMRSLEVIFRDGRRWCFEVIRTEADSTTEPLRSARILRREDASGQGVTLRYDVTVADAYAAEAADPAGYNLDRLWHLASVTGPYGNVASFTYTASPLLQAWPIERIDLPDGNAVTYAYDATGRLTGVAHPDGSQSVFTYFQPADPNLHGIGIFDPAADPTHRRKELFLTKASWSDGTSAPVPVPADRVVRMNNGAGELAFASWERVISGIRSNIYTYWGGNRYDRIEQSRGIILGKSFASVPVFAADGSLDENATTWEPLEAYDGHQYRMARERTDALGRVTDFSIDFTRRITGRTDHADGSSSFTLFESADGTSEFNWVKKETDRLGRVTTFTRDANGNLLTKTVAAGTPAEATETWTRNGRGQPLSYTDANGNTTEYFYSSSGTPASIDGEGYLVRVLDPADAAGGPRPVTQYAYDAQGKLIESTDPAGRAVTYGYDQRNRLTTVGYFDGSQKTYLYGANGSGDENLRVETIDRNGHREVCAFDGADRETACTEAFGTPVAVSTTTIYLTGTEEVLTRTRHGETAAFIFDNKNRVVATTRQPDGGTALTSGRNYDAGQRMRSTTDPYDRGTFHAFDVNDRKVRTVVETTPGAVTLPHDDATAAGVLANDAYLMSLTRLAGPNAGYLIDDCAIDAEGQQITCTDPRGITDAFTYDAQGRRTTAVEAFALSSSFGFDAAGLRLPNNTGSPTPVAARTETVYDPQGNVIEMKTPRVFDTSPEGDVNARTVMTYTGRNLLAKTTEAPGTPIAATTSFTYNLDQTLDQQTDARGNAWSKLWGVCCARIMAVLDPPADVDGDGDLERAATVTRHDFHGNLTHQGRIEDVDDITFPNFQLTGSNSTDLPDAGTLSETTTRYDARHRPVASTSWMVPLGAVDPDNVPIAGGGQSGDPAVEVAGEVQGLTTTYAYDDDLTDGQGLEVAYATQINARLGASFFATGSDGSAMAMTNPEGETSVRFSDGLGRTVLSVDPTGDASSTDFDAVITLAGFGDVVQTTSADPLNHTTSQRTDGAGRTLETIDQLGFVTTYAYDANSNLVSFRDPNGVGEDCGYDLRDRKELCYDTEEGPANARVYGFDANNNLVLSRDASGTDDTCVYDARDRKTVCTDRVGAVTVYAYDPNSNLASITDGEGGLTSYTYDARNLQTLTVYPNDGSQPGGLDPVGGDRVAMAYDGLRRPSSKLDQAGIVTGFAYDLAGRMIERSYAEDADADPATPPVLADQDGFAYDLASRPTGATQGPLRQYA